MTQEERILKVRSLMRERETARKNSDYEASDKLRLQLQVEYGVKVIDQKNGPSGWKFLDGTSNKIDPTSKSSITTIKKPSDTSTKSKDKVGSKRNATDDEENEMEPTTTKIKQSTPTKKQKLDTEADRNKKALQSLQQSRSKSINGVIIEDLEIGSGGEIASNGHRVKVYYVGKLKTNNKVFDSSTKKPFTFRLGKGEVIRGWDIGVAGMKIGGKRRLTIPPEKAYGKSGAPPTIPGNATLVFDVTLLHIS